MVLGTEEKFRPVTWVPPRQPFKEEQMSGVETEDSGVRLA